MTFYDKFLRLCVAFDKAPSKVAQDIGISKSTVTRWKNGGGITDPIALKLADYFDIPVSEIKNDLPLNTDMDISLERVLSLIPRKPNGDFVHGEKKKFAMSIGFKSGEIVSDWIAGRSTSYKDYLYEIADKYNVSVDWLLGESTIREKQPAPISPPVKDITLERILSLIPKKPNGDFAHGAKKEFCSNIGAPTNIISEWISGKTKSYKNYLYVISAKYNVSVAWLMGETDICERELSPQLPASPYPSKYQLLNSENKQLIDTLIIKLLKSQAID